MMEGPTSPVPIPGIAKRSTFVPSPRGHKNGETAGSGYQIDLSQAHVMQELNARHSVTALATASAKGQAAAPAHPQTPQGKRAHSGGGDPQRPSSAGPVEPKKPARSLSPTSDFWRQQARATERSASSGLQEVLVYSGHYASALPPVPGGVKEREQPAAKAGETPRARLTVSPQSPTGSLASGLAGLAVSGGRSEFPVVPVEATLVKAVLLWTAGSAQSVEVKGSWDGWGPARRLRQQPDATWCIAAYLTPGMYQYKYVVNGVWRYDPWAPVVRDEDGNLNNVLEVIDPCTSFDIPPEFDAPSSPISSYAQELPVSGDLAAEPPLLPPQAQLTPLDLGLPAGATAWPEAGDPRPLHPAEHAVLNHAYIARSSHRSSAHESELPKEPMILGCTVKHRAKTIITLVYKPRPAQPQGMTESVRLPSGAMPDINR